MPEQNAEKKEPPTVVWMYLAFVIVTSFFTYAYRYTVPTSPFWDEPYHIASAEKYLNGVYFMEPHPPLGKLFIALGEKLLHPNAATNTFINTDYARNFPEGYSFAGVRLFPTLFGWITSVVFFFLFLYITRSSALAAIFSFLYIFDNAEIVHSRAAMLDSTLSFFSLLTVLLFFMLLDRKRSASTKTFVTLSALFGVAFACALATKVVALVLVLLVPAIAVQLVPHWKRLVYFLVVSGIAFTGVYAAVWEVHFNVGTRIVAELPDSGYYQASPAYKKILTDKKTSSIAAFPVMLRDSLAFVGHYSKGVPRLDLCKADENGSPSYFWPFGARTINYRWEKSGEHATRYMYLVSNPVAWGLGLLGVVLSVVLLVSRFIGDRTEPLRHEFHLLSVLALYVGYMVAISRLDRVMYLYHYFLPLQFSFLLFALAFMNIRRLWRIAMTESTQLIVLTLLGLLIFASFQFYRPLSYYEPISNAALERRAILPLWELTCVGCTKTSALVVPRT